ncbi:helix-turn-helix domain-containing protein [Enterobacter chuandaensis]|uniref:helix-turn-helix transcriptional regulator n=1 Tax=Enterobacter chuandaensis TaxID=2497875 RepID=UPI003217CB6B
MSDKELFELLDKKRSAVYNLIKKHGFPPPVLTHPARFSRRAVEKWLSDGGVNRRKVAQDE